MLEEKDLQAIAQLMDQKLSQQKQDILGEVKDQLSQQKQEILKEATQSMKVLLDAEVTPKFNLLAEEIQGLHDKLDRMAGPEDLELLESRVDTLELAVRKHSREISELKKAQ